MTHWTEAADLLEERAEAGLGFVARYAPGAGAFVLSAALGVYLVYLRPAMHVPVAPPPPVLAAAVKSDADVFGALVPVVPPPAAPARAKPAADPFGALVLKGFGSSDRFAVVEIPVPPVAPDDLRSSEEGVPLPPRRPSAIARTEEPPESAPLEANPPAVARLEPTPAPTPGLLQKLFGGIGSNAPKEPEQQLAYAAPPPSAAASTALASRNGIGGTGGFGGFLRGLGFGSNRTSRFGDHVAVYDISARMVYLPDGTRIEAHSGLGTARDDPSKVDERMRGPTPPATYVLSPREELFHGVAALRLTPIDGNIYGRAGLLAHTYMLGPDGDSNGCVSFRDYDAFLRAYRSGEITKLVVVTHI